MHVLYIGAHGGFDTGRLPLGGGAAVMDALVREWSRSRPFALTVLGVGDGYDLPGVRSVRLPVELSRALTDMTEGQYARFCRQFERAATEWIAREPRPAEGQPRVVLTNDIAEGPDFQRLRALGLRVVSLWHVDVVEYVSKIYGHGLLSAPRFTALHRLLARARLERFLPDVCRLIFQKQADCVACCQRLVLPSRGMAEVLARCYPIGPRQIEVLPWGVIGEDGPPGPSEVRAVRAELGVADGEIVLLTLCRISPEKGIDRLLRALRRAERRHQLDLRPVRLIVAGAPAYMRGQQYQARLQRLARRLRRVRVHFAGHVRGERKGALFAAADMYVHLSRHESYGLTLAEAMRAGCPVLTTDHHSARDLVPPDCGRIVSGRTEETVAALRDLLADRERLRAMGRAAAEHARGLDFSRAAARLAAILAEVAQEGGGCEAV